MRKMVMASVPEEPTPLPPDSSVELSDADLPSLPTQNVDAEKSQVKEQTQPPESTKAVVTAPPPPPPPSPHPEIKVQPVEDTKDETPLIAQRLVDEALRLVVNAGGEVYTANRTPHLLSILRRAQELGHGDAFLIEGIMWPSRRLHCFQEAEAKGCSRPALLYAHYGAHYVETDSAKAIEYYEKAIGKLQT